MKTLLALVSIFIIGGSAFAQTNDLTYQGRLVDGSVAATGSYDFVFKLFDDPEDPVAPQVGTDQVRDRKIDRQQQQIDALKTLVCISNLAAEICKPEK